MSVDIVIPQDWWRSRATIVELVEDMIDRGELITASDANYVHEHPYKYTPEFKRMLRDRAAEEAA